MPSEICNKLKKISPSRHYVRYISIFKMVMNSILFLTKYNITTQVLQRRSHSRISVDFSYLKGDKKECLWIPNVVLSILNGTYPVFGCKSGPDGLNISRHLNRDDILFYYYY
jgi:hypothetical protein